MEINPWIRCDCGKIHITTHADNPVCTCGKEIRKWETCNIKKK